MPKVFPATLARPREPRWPRAPFRFATTAPDSANNPASPPQRRSALSMRELPPRKPRNLPRAPPAPPTAPEFRLRKCCLDHYKLHSSRFTVTVLHKFFDIYVAAFILRPCVHPVLVASALRGGS